MDDGDKKEPEVQDTTEVVDPQEADESEESNEILEGSGESISWSASEFVAHKKGFAWFFGLLVVVVVIAAVVLIITHSIFSVAMIALIGLAFAIAAARQPRVLDYRVDGAGVTIHDKLHPYHALKSFSVVSDAGLRSILIIPARRLVPPISIYYEPDDEDKIVELMGMHLPQEDSSKDYVEQLMRRMRF